MEVICDSLSQNFESKMTNIFPYLSIVLAIYEKQGE